MTKRGIIRAWQAEGGYVIKKREEDIFFQFKQVKEDNNWKSTIFGNN